jgi:hypothetical protein
VDAHSASQLIHYAKGRFLRWNTFKDLRVLVGKYAAVPPETVSDRDILTVLCDAALPFLFASHNPQHHLTEILLNLGAARYQERPAQLVAEELLTILRLIRVRDGERTLVELAEPDFSLLPPATS